jgi:nucleoid-associated protein YgaU
MGNFEKLGILVIIVLVVVILVLTVWGVGVPVDELGADLTPTNLSSENLTNGGSGGGGTNEPSEVPDPPDPVNRRTWPDPVDPVDPPDPIDPVDPVDPVDPPDPVPPSYLTHVVKEGENPYRLAVHYFSDGSKFQLILDANPEIDPQRITVGTKLRIPNPAGISAVRPAPDPDPTPNGIYVVKKGDSLWVIAKRELGNGSAFTRILEANAELLGGDPDAIMPGMKLRIPR